jgi:hypothetical protein
MRFLLAAVLGAHGIAHFVGFVFSWQIATLVELPYKTTILAGRIDLGDGGIRAMGLLWLLGGLGLLIAAVAVATDAPWAHRLTALMVAMSLVLCAIGWPDSRIGLVVNVALAVALVVNARWPVLALVR